MIHQRSVLLLLVMMVVLVLPTMASTLRETFVELQREIDDRDSEVDSDVFVEFKRKYKCHDCDDKTFDMLLH